MVEQLTLPLMLFFSWQGMHFILKMFSIPRTAYGSLKDHTTSKCREGCPSHFTIVSAMSVEYEGYFS